MKNLKSRLAIFVALALVLIGCQEDDIPAGDIIAPSNIEITVDKVGADAANPNGDGSGTVNFTVSADNATAFHFIAQNQTKLVQGGKVSHDFTTLGETTYAVTVVAFGTGGASTSETIEVVVLALYEPPADLLQMLHGTDSRTWRIKAEGQPHFGLGPPGGFTPGEWFNAAPFEKATVGMYDDRYIFDADGTFTHITNGDVFGRDPLINELGSSGGTVNGADIENLPFDDYSEQWILTAPGGSETLSLTGLGFIGYYIGGDHKYTIFERSPDEMVLRSTDGNGEFGWWFGLIAE